MIQLGKRAGQYSFNNLKITKARGFEKTNFEIEILTIKNNSFTGTVQDDLLTGGMEGVGEIKGAVKGNRIDFVKLMPIMTLIVVKNGTRQTYNKKHRPIFYTGLFSSDGQTVSGTWRFKLGVIWFGIVPILRLPSNGTWTMKRK